MGKLCFIIEKINPGGAERVIINLANMFADKGYKIIFVVMLRNNLESIYKLHDNIEFINLNILPIQKDSSDHLSLFFKKIMLLLKKVHSFKSILKEKEISVIISFLPTNILVSFLACIGTKTKLIVSQRNDPYQHYRNNIKKCLFRFIFTFSDGCVFQNSEQMKFFTKNTLAHSVIIQNLIANKFFSLKQPLKRKHIIGVGRYNSQKRWDVAIQAFSLIHTLSDDLLYIYGGISNEYENTEYENLKNLVILLGLENRVKLYNVTEKIEEQINNAKLFIFSSDFEGMPNALIEAQVIGVPCISTEFDGGGAREIIANGINGLLVPKGDVESLAMAMSLVLTDEEMAKKLSDNTDTIREKYRPENVFAQWEDYINKVLRE